MSAFSLYRSISFLVLFLFRKPLGAVVYEKSNQQCQDAGM